MGWVCCKCGADNTGAVLWCKVCQHYTVNCGGCFSYRQITLPNKETTPKGIQRKEDDNYGVER